MSELWAFSAIELAAMVRRCETSAVEIAQAHLDRIERFNAELRAFVHVDREGALREARSADARPAVGPLHGVPIAYKDIIDVAGLPTTAGSRILGGNVARDDADLVARIRANGAICLGKLNTTEFASGDMAYFGEARNPWDTTRTTGGSSSGPAGAVAARLTPLAVGTDTGGSVRVPASFCGIVGLRPSRRRVGARGVIPLSWTHDSAGPMARDVPDAALLLAAMSGVPEFAAELVSDGRQIRVGVPADSGDVDPRVAASVSAATDVLLSAGASLRTVQLPDLDLAYTAQWALAYTEAWLLHRATFASRWTDYGVRFRRKIAGAALLTAEEFVLAERVRGRISAAFDAAFEAVDVIAMPTTGYPANRIDQHYPGGDAARLTRPVSVARLPALSIPCGFSADGLPIGVQLIGNHDQELTLLRIGKVFEQETGRRMEAPEPPLRPGFGEHATAPRAQTQAPGRLSSEWVLEAARMLDLPYVSESDAEAIGASIGPIKDALARARVAYRDEPSLPAG